MFKKPTIFTDDSGSHVLGIDGSVKASFTVADHGASHEGAAISHLQQNFDDYMGEEAEQIDEIKASTLKSYRSKAREDKEDAEDEREFYKAHNDQKEVKRQTKRRNKRVDGINMADDKMNGGARSTVKIRSVGEETEQIDELSKKTMGRYINKAKDVIDITSWRQGHREASNGNPSGRLEKKLTKRHKGIETAVKKLANEEAEQTDEAVYNGHRPTGLHGSNPLPKPAQDALTAKLRDLDAKMDASRKNLASKPNSATQPTIAESQKPYVSTRQGHAVVLGPNGQELKKFTKAQHGASYMTKANAYLDQHYGSLSKQNEEVELDETSEKKLRGYLDGHQYRMPVIKTKMNKAGAIADEGKDASERKKASKEWDALYKTKQKREKGYNMAKKQLVKKVYGVEEEVKNPYAVGMAAAEKLTGDTPPLKKSTIVKAHNIAKEVMKENKLLTGALKKLQEGRGRPPKEGSAAWKAQQAAGGQSEDTPGLEAQLLRHKDQGELGSHEIKFNDGATHKVSAPHREKVLSAIRSHRGAGTDPDHRDAALKHMSSSHENFKKWATGTVKKVEPKGWELNKTPRFT